MAAYDKDIQQGKDGVWYRWLGENEQGTKQNFRLGRDKPEAKRRIGLIIALFEMQEDAARFFSGSWVSSHLEFCKKDCKRPLSSAATASTASQR